MPSLPPNFVYSSHPARVIFGSGTSAQLTDEVDRLGLKHVMVLATSHQRTDAEALAARLGSRTAAVFAGAAMHTPVTVTETALAVAQQNGADGFVALGGGSSTGLGKALALRTDLPQIVLPTTYAGSEMTPILGETANGRKTTLTSPKVLPEVVIYDVDLTLSLPAGLSGTSGINAIAHAVEALYARDRNPVTDLLALEAIGALAQALPLIAKDPRDKLARTQALYGAWLCGTCLGSVGMALHHKLCHTLGGTFDLPHAETHTVLLPHTLAYNAPAIPDVMNRLGVVLGGEASRTLYDLAGAVGAERSLGALGMPADGVEKAADLALANPYWNPRPLDRNGIRGLITRAFEGAPPAA